MVPVLAARGEEASLGVWHERQLECEEPERESEQSEMEVVATRCFIFPCT